MIIGNRNGLSLETFMVVKVALYTLKSLRETSSYSTEKRLTNPPPEKKNYVFAQNA